MIATITDAQQNVTTYGYGAHGNRTSVTDALSNQTTFAYGAGDRLITITYPPLHVCHLMLRRFQRRSIRKLRTVEAGEQSHGCSCFNLARSRFRMVFRSTGTCRSSWIAHRCA